MGRMETALVVIVWVGLVLVGPPALLFWLIRRRKRREQALRDAAIAAAATPPPSLEPASNISIDAASSATESEQSGYRVSFPYGVPMVVYPILAVGLSVVQRTWLVALMELLLVILAVAFTREAFSRASFDKIRASDPSMNLATWRINWLLFFAAPPAVLAVFGAARLWLGKSG
jgi:hypothetical protein